MSAIGPLALITAMHIVGLTALLWAALHYGGRPAEDAGEEGDGRGGPPKPPAGRRCLMPRRRGCGCASTAALAPRAASRVLRRTGRAAYR
jgi:hypothetical protein